MKNLHLLPTDKPSRLACFEYITNVQGIDKRALKFKFWNDFISSKDLKDGGYFPQNIYIISNEEIKEGDWCLDVFTKSVFKYGKGLAKGQTTLLNATKKIILTTDQDLIADGVDAIDDEFLEWFIKNPSCEYVKVILDRYTNQPYFPREYSYQYKIIIPQEEPKQPPTFPQVNIIDEWLKEHGDPETTKQVEREAEEIMENYQILEEAARRLLYSKYPYHPPQDSGYWEDMFKEGAKWQAERMYSEEDLRKAFRGGYYKCYRIGQLDAEHHPLALSIANNIHKDMEEWFEQLKKTNNGK